MDFFPSAALTFSPSEKHQFNATYSRRIDRPDYQDLNPFEFKVDELTYEKGNAFLRPQYTNNVQISHTYLGALNTSFGYSHTNDYFTQLIDTIESSRSFITKRNLAEHTQYTFNTGIPIPIWKWLESYVDITAYRSYFKADFGDGKKINLHANGLSLYSQHTFSLPKDFSIELSGFYNAPTVEGGTFQTKGMWSVDIGAQKKLFDDRATLKLSLTDVFKSLEWTAETNYGGLYIDVGSTWESQTLSLNFTYRFGSQQVAAARERRTGLQDESQRVKNK